MRRICLVAWMAGCLGLASAQTVPPAKTPAPSEPKPMAVIATPEQLSKSVGELANPRFAVREKASKTLWEAGRASETLLREAAKSSDEETANRAKAILEKFDWGIYPDTPAEVLKLIEKFRGASEPNVRQDALGEIMRLKPTQFATLRKLIARETNPDFRMGMFFQLAQQARIAVPALLVANQFDEVGELLEICISKDNQTAMGDFAAFQFLRGKLPDTIKRYEAEARKLKGEDRSRTLETLAYLHRAAKNWGGAVKAASDDKNGALELELAWEASDWKTLAKSDLPPLENGDDDTRGLLAAYHRKAGDKAKYDETIADLRKDLTGIEGDDFTARRVSKALLLNGEGGEAIKLLKDRPGTASILVFDLLCAQLKFQEAFAFADKALKEIEKDEEADQRQLELNFRRVIILANLGEIESATQLCRKQLEMLNGKAELAVVVLTGVRDLVRAGQRGLAMECLASITKLALGARGREPVPIEAILNQLYEEKSLVPTLWLQAIRKVEGEKDILDQFRRIDQLFAGKGTAKDIALLEKALSEKPPATIRPGTVPVNFELNSHALAELYRLHRDDKKAEAAYKLSIKAKSSDKSLPLPGVSGEPFEEFIPDESVAKTLFMGYADFLGKLGRHAEAAVLYERAWEDSPSEPMALFLCGQSLIKSGDAKKGRALAEAAHWVPLGDEIARTAFSEELSKRGFDEDSRREMQLVLDVGWFRSFQVGNVHLRMARQLARKKEFAKAAEFYEKDVISLFRTGATFQDPRAFLTVPELARGYRLRAMIAAGKINEALAEAKRSLDLLPGNVELAIDFVPELDKAGRKTEGDALYKQLRDAYEAAIKDFGNSADLRNSVAWVMVNCNRDLADAKKHAEMAVKLRPDSAGYLDTLAEIQFRMKDRPKALEMMKKCAEMEPKNPYYRKQLERFEKKPFDSMPPDEETGDD